MSGMRVRIAGNRASKNHPLSTWSLVAAVSIAALAGTMNAEAQDVDAGQFAAAIRASGHPCARVIESASKGDSVWHVRCNAGWYEVTKKGDSTVKVVPLD
ncbi:MAG: hypothetical protein GTO59_07655 [Gammaproteobacteria bacterium]|nr:hypothetical protein [Gammaproteobacteria bacterium]